MKTQDSQNVNDKAADVADTKDPNTVQLDTPIKRGDGHITSVTLRKPNSGELRGVSLAELLQMKVNLTCISSLRVGQTCRVMLRRSGSPVR